MLTVRADEAAAWLALNDTEFSRRIAGQFENRLGAMRLAGERHCYPLVAVYADAFASDRLALVGDAAVGMHPVTAHGYNFGLYGIERLVTASLHALKLQGRDLGDTAALQRWAAEHHRPPGRSIRERTPSFACSPMTNRSPIWRAAPFCAWPAACRP